MKARELIRKGGYPPDQLNVLFEAFDGAWAQIANHFYGESAERIEAARERLARAIVAAAANSSEPTLDAGALKNLALEIMALNRGGEFSPPGQDSN